MRRVLASKRCSGCGAVSYSTSSECHICGRELQIAEQISTPCYNDNRLGSQFVRAHPALQLDRGCTACASIVSRLNGGTFDLKRIASEIVNNADRAGLLAFGKNRQEQKHQIAALLERMQADARFQQALAASPWAVGITTAPRAKPTLQATLTSLANAGWEGVQVFADGDCDVPNGYLVTRRQCAAGAFSNWLLGLTELVQRQPKATWYAMFQDDLVLCRGVRERVESLDWSGVLSLYQSVHHRSDKTRLYTGGRGFVGALGLVFDRETAHKLISSDLGVSHRLRRTRQNDWIDGAVGQWCKQNDVTLWIHGPSLCQHIGDTSTLGHSERPTEKFVGEDFDATTLPVSAITNSKKPRGKRIGLVGYNTAQGLGYVNRDIAQWLDVHDWIITKHPRFPMLDRPKSQYQIADMQIPDDELRERLQGLDVVMFVEVCPPNLPRVAKSLGIKTVCVPMVEWLPLQEGWTQSIDLWIAPTLFSYSQLVTRGVRGDVRYTPWPIDTSRFAFRQRKKLERYVFAHGNGGPRDRKGGKLLAEAAAMVPEIPLIVYSQQNQSGQAESVQWPNHVDFRGDAKTPADLYAGGDCMIMPSRWEGLGLQLYECQAAGLPLITTGAPPMTEANPWRTMPPTPTIKHLTHDMPSWNVAPVDIAAAMRDALGADIRQASEAARAWVVEHRDWSRSAEAIRSLITH